MTDELLNNQKGFKDQYFETFGFPMIFCEIHKNSTIESININNLNQNKLACTKCIINEGLNPEFLISVEDVFSKNPNQILKNWPPLLDQNIYQQLISNDVQENKITAIIPKIDEYFDILKTDVLNIIERQQKKILIFINNIEENRQNVLDIYNQISDKDEIKEQFLTNINNQLELQEQLKQTISSKQKFSTVNSQKINDALDVLTKSLQQFQFDYIDKLFQQSLISLESIDLLNPNVITEQHFSQRISNDTKNQVIYYDNKLSEMVDQIMKVTKKANQWNQNFLKNDKNAIIETTQTNGLNSEIIEKNINQQCNDSYEINLLEQINIIKSNCYYDYISSKKIDYNFIEICHHSIHTGWSQVFIDQVLIPETKYQIQIEFKSQNNNNDNIFLGLLPQSLKDEAGWSSKLSLNTDSDSCGIEKIDSGYHISSIKKLVQYITFQICLKEQILRCLSVVNNQSNINSKANWNNLRLNENFYFYIGLKQANSKVEIQQFKIVNQFDQW